MTLEDVAIGEVVRVEHVGGERSFRRRLMELGLVPGTRVELVGVAPLGDPLELLVRGASLSIRRSEARAVSVVAREHESREEAAERSESKDSVRLPSCARGAP